VHAVGTVENLAEFVTHPSELFVATTLIEICIWICIALFAVKLNRSRRVFAE